MVIDRVGPTITTLKAEVDFLGAELAAVKADNERLRAVVEVFACDCEGKAICLGNCMHRNARAALEGRT